MAGLDPYDLGPEDSVHLWGDDEADMQMSDWDYEPAMCGWCGKDDPVCPPGTHGSDFIYD